MAAPRPVDIRPEPRFGPSAADVAGRVQSADPQAQAQAQARIRLQAMALQQQQQQQQQHVSDRQAEQHAPRQKASGFGTVKAVLSADCVVLIGSEMPNRPAPEKQVTLSGVSAPRPTRRKGQDDEPFAWHSREFLRQKLIGKRVKFAITHVHESSGREYGTIELDGEDVASMVVAAGWATVKMPTRAGKESSVSSDREELVALEAAAKEAKLGIFQDDKKKALSKRKIERVSGSGARAFFEKSRGKVINGIVDQVREGSALRIEFPYTDNKGELRHQIVMMNLAGVQCPRIPIPHSVRLATYERQKEENPNANIERPKAEQPEPFAVEALHFTDNRLLHRDVSVRVLGCDKLHNLFGTVHVPQGDISLMLVRKGLARVVPWSAALASTKDELYAEEAEAKKQRLRIWSNFTDADAADETPNAFTAKVVEIVSGDVLVVCDSRKKESRVYLASIRAPRQGYRERPGEPWSREAREYLRKRLVGRKVRVLVDYVRVPPAESREKDKRQYVSILLGKENISETYTAHGLATVVRHRLDEDRSQFYDDLVAAETKASTEKKGVHNPKAPVCNPIIDLTGKVRVPESGDPVLIEELTRKARETAIKSRQFLPFLQNERRVQAIVEHVFSGSRMKLFVPSQNIMISFALAGIRSPSSRGDAPEEFANEATAFTRGRVLQHLVEIDVETLDKGDNFLGSLFAERKNLSLLLLDRGLASVVPYSAERSPYAEELFTAEKLAQQQRLRIWKNWTEPKPEETVVHKARDAVESQPRQVQKLLVSVPEAYDATNFFIQDADDSKLSALKSGIEQVLATPRPIGEFRGSKGDICLGKFSDGSWYRCRIERFSNTCDGFEVSFIDYGNRCSMPTSSLRALPPSTLRQPPLARPAVLSGVRLARDYYEESADAFLSVVWERRFVASIDATDPSTGKLHVTLVDADDVDDEQKGPNETLSVNARLLRAGLVRIPGKPLRSLRAVVDKLKPFEKEALNARLGIWEYGDVSSDEDEEEQNTRGRR